MLPNLWLHCSDFAYLFQIKPIKPGAPIVPAAQDVLPQQTTPESDIELLMLDSSEAPDSDAKAPKRKLMKPAAGKPGGQGSIPLFLQLSTSCFYRAPVMDLNKL